MAMLSRFMNEQVSATETGQNSVVPEFVQDVIYPEQIQALTDVESIRQLHQNLVAIRDVILVETKTSMKKEKQDNNNATRQSSPNAYSDSKQKIELAANRVPTNNLPSTNNISQKTLLNPDSKHGRKLSQGNRIDRNGMNKDLESLEHDSNSGGYLRHNPKIRVISRGSMNIKAVLSKE